MHAAILRDLEALGYATSVRRLGDHCELHAVNVMPGIEEPVHIARVDGDTDEDVYRAARALAEMCGVDLEG
jgi:hypothetical protein